MSICPSCSHHADCDDVSPTIEDCGDYEAIDYTKVAHDIIDVVEMAIRQAHSNIDKYANKLVIKGDIPNEPDEKPNTLLYGEAYYNLENEIVRRLKEDLP